jgi:hypothetical protein
MANDHDQPPGRKKSTGGGEFERQRVPDSALKGPSKFWGMYAGEHAAGTEFMIGPLFLAAGASLQDLVLGLRDEFAQRQGLSVNVAVLIAWSSGSRC